MDKTIFVMVSLALCLSLVHTHKHTQAFNDSYLIGKRCIEERAALTGVMCGCAGGL